MTMNYASTPEEFAAEEAYYLRLSEATTTTEKMLGDLKIRFTRPFQGALPLQAEGVMLNLPIHFYFRERHGVASLRFGIHNTEVEGFLLTEAQKAYEESTRPFKTAPKILRADDFPRRWFSRTVREASEPYDPSELFVNLVMMTDLPLLEATASELKYETTIALPMNNVITLEPFMRTDSTEDSAAILQELNNEHLLFHTPTGNYPLAQFTELSLEQVKRTAEWLRSVITHTASASTVISPDHFNSLVMGFFEELLPDSSFDLTQWVEYPTLAHWVASQTSPLVKARQPRVVRDFQEYVRKEVS